MKALIIRLEEWERIKKDIEDCLLSYDPLTLDKIRENRALGALKILYDQLNKIEEGPDENYN